MPSAIEEMSSAVVKDAPVSAPADIAPAIPTPQPAVPAPAPAPAPEKPATPVKPAAEPQKPAEDQQALQKASEKMARIVGDKKVAPKVDKAKVAEAPDEEVEKHIKPNAAAWRVYEAKKKAWAEKEASFTAKTSELEKKIAELSSKPNPTVADDAKLKALEEKLAARENEFKSVRQKLEERDYTQSDEYKEKFEKPWNRTFGEAYSFVEGLQVMDPETGEPARQATKADFDKVLNVPLQQRRAAAKALFGEDSASDVVEFAKEIDRIRKGANEAVTNHAQNWEKLSQERQRAQEADAQKFSQLENSERTELEQKFPDYFSVDHLKGNPELQKALSDGYAEYDGIVSNFSKMPPQEQAAAKVLVRAWAAAFPLMHRQNAALKTQVESLTAELSKLRGSDPGSAKPATGTPAPAEDMGGIKDFAGKFAK